MSDIIKETQPYGIDTKNIKIENENIDLVSPTNAPPAKRVKTVNRKSKVIDE